MIASAAPPPQANAKFPSLGDQLKKAHAKPRSASAIRINYWNPSKILAASNTISGSGTQGVYSSADGGVTWGQTNLPLASGDSFHSDPTVEWTSDGTAWSSTMGINGNV